MAESGCEPQAREVRGPVAVLRSPPLPGAALEATLAARKVSSGVMAARSSLAQLRIDVAEGAAPLARKGRRPVDDVVARIVGSAIGAWDDGKFRDVA